MKNVLKSLLRRGADESGATAIEYVLILAIVSVALITGFQTLKSSITGKLSTITSAVSSNT